MQLLTRGEGKHSSERATAAHVVVPSVFGISAVHGHPIQRFRPILLQYS